MRRSFMRRALPLLAVAGLALAAAGTAGATNYIVLYKQEALPANTTNWVERSGGSVVASYPQIGVVIAQSNSTTFRDAMKADTSIEEVAASTMPIAKVDPLDIESHQPPPELPNAPSTADNLAPLQWDMRQIHAFEAHAHTGGSPAVVTGIIDTGVDKDHPDLAQNLDFSRSASCESGAPVPAPGAWDDVNGHGTHTAGTVAAADNGLGIVGVAPRTRIAAIKASNDDGYFFPEMVICAFMWAGTVQVDVTNNSYFADPFLYNCRNDPVQRAIWKAEKRAIDYATRRGVTHVAAIGNDGDDRAHPAYDVISPDFPPGQEEEREITNACLVIPVEVDGVIGVTAVGNFRQTDGNDDPDEYQKSFYSAYGVGVADVTAPGGDSRYVTPEAPNGRVLSTYPAEAPCFRPAADVEPGVGAGKYCYLQGTSMASPHAAGVAALIISRFGDLKNPQNGKMRPQQVEQYLQHTADPQPCPTFIPFFAARFLLRPHPAGVPGEPQVCQGGEGYNSWYGSGQVNALKAVLHSTTNQP